MYTLQDRYQKDDTKHNSYPSMNNQNANNLSATEREHIMLFNPLNGGLSGSFTGVYLAILAA